MNENSLVTVASYSFPHEAQIAKSRLEIEGILAFIADEHTINMQWLYSNALGGVRVQVQAKHMESAKEILNQDLSHLVDEEFGEQTKVCEACGSYEVTPYTKGKKPAFILFLLLGFPLFFYKHGIKCEKCGNFSKT